MKKIAMTLLVAGVGLWAAPASAEVAGESSRAIPDSAIESGDGLWFPPQAHSVSPHHRRWRTQVSSLQGPYVSADIGESAMNNVDLGNYNGFSHYNSGLTILGAVGYGFQNNYRVEGEVGYQTNDNNHEYGAYANRNISVVSFLANGYYDIPAFGIAQPYITAGVGVANVNADALNAQRGMPDIPSTNNTAFAYQIGAGITMPIGNNIKLDVRYRYFVTNVTVDTAFENNRLSSNSVLVGLKIGIGSAR